MGGGLLAASSWMNSPLGFAAVFGLAGGLIGATGFYSITQAIAARTSPHKPHVAITRLTIWGAFSSPLFIPITEVARRWWGWRTTLRLDAAWVTVAFCAAIAADPLRIAVAERPSRNPLRAATTALGDPTIRRLVGSAATTAAAMEILLLYQVRIMTAAGLAASAASGFAGARGLAQLLGRLPLARTIAHFGVRATMVAARIGLAVGCMLIVWSGHTWVAVVYVFVAGATLGALSPLEGIFATITLPPDDLGSLMGGLALLSGVAGATGPILAAVIVDATNRTAHAAILAAGSRRWVLSSSRSERLVPRCTFEREERGEERVDSTANLVANWADGVDVLPCRVVELPVLIPLAGVQGAGIAAAHRDDDIRGSDDLVGPRLGKLGSDVDADLRHHGDRCRVDL